MVRLLPDPCVCQTTPHRLSPFGPAASTVACNGLLRRVELVIAGDDLDNPVVVLVVLKGDEVPQQLQQPRSVEGPANQHFQFQERTARPPPPPRSSATA